MTGHKPQGQAVLVAACLLYCISWYLPSPLIGGKDTSFTTHLIGGGVFTGLIWLYLKNNVQWKGTTLTDFCTLFALVCTFGVINELLELLAVQIGLIHLSLSDTSWDLFSNTLGALLFWIVYVLLRKAKHLTK
ncbi:MAG TPA: hypothetical protein VLA04_01280 [Verrucomicrobiae bacterium]|nr:hypothetical protein [Verrucomicrobiae bacterium]